MRIYEMVSAREMRWKELSSNVRNTTIYYKFGFPERLAKLYIFPFFYSLPLNELPGLDIASGKGNVLGENMISVIISTVILIFIKIMFVWFSNMSIPKRSD